MPSSYSPSLRIELVADNEQSGVWGQTTNRNFSQVIEEALTGTAEVDVTAADVTLTAVNGATDQARRPFIRVIGTPTVARQVNVPDVNKNYLVQNTTGQTITIKPTGQTGSAVLPGQSAFIRTRQGASSQMIEFVATSGGNLALSGALSVAGPLTTTGPLTVTSTTTAQIGLRSGAAGSMAYYDFGRTAREGSLGVSGGVSQMTTGDVAGDATLRAEQRLWIGVAGAGHIKMDATDGILSRVAHNFNGDLGSGTLTTKVGLGTSSGFPFQRFTIGSAPADQKQWDMYANVDSLVFRSVNDAYNVANTWLQVKRTGAAIDYLQFSGRIGFGRVPDVQPYEFAVSPSSAGSGGLRVIASPTLGTQLLITGPTYNYAGVGGNQAWLYAQGTMDVNVGPDGAGTVALVSGGARRFTVSNSMTTSLQPVWALADNGFRFTNAGNTVGGYLQAIPSIGTRLTSDTSNIVFHVGGIDRLTLVSDGRFMGNALHNNPNGIQGNASQQFIGSGTYTPAITNLSNFNAPANIYIHNYTRVGNVVSVAGQINIGCPTVAQASLRISLPIPSTFSTAANGNGTGTFQVGGAFTTFALETGASGTTITLIGMPPATGNGLLTYHFQYVVA